MQVICETDSESESNDDPSEGEENEEGASEDEEEEEEEGASENIEQENEDESILVPRKKVIQKNFIWNL